MSVILLNIELATFLKEEEENNRFTHGQILIFMQ